jgi:outer membrane protein OmpA-like peptidoglycan-associated protein
MKLYIFLFFLVIHLSYSQTPNPIRYGAFLGGGYDIHSTNFSALRGVPNCCPVFEGGSGTGFQVQGVVEVPFSTEFFLATHIGYTQRTGMLQKDESTTLFVNNQPSNGVFRHTLELQHSQLLLDILPHFTFFEKLSIFAGFSAGYMLSPTFNQRETIAVPEFGSTFVDSNGNNSNQRIRNQFSGDLPDANPLQLGIMAGMGYTVPLNASSSLLARPEVSLRLPLNSYASSVSWNATSLQVGVSILYRSIEKVDTIPIIAVKNTPMEITETIKPLVKEVVEEKKDEKYSISGRTLKSDGTPLQTTIIIEDLKTGEAIGKSESNPKTGAYNFSLDFGRYYSYSFQADGFYPPSKRIDLRTKPNNNSHIEEDVVIKSIEEIIASGEEILINNIFFETSKAELLQESFSELNKLIEVLNKYPSVNVVLEAHTDNIGSDKYNDDLSLRRANAVQVYLVSKAISPNRITEVGFGKRKPISSNDTEEGRALNRRVQFRLETKK